MKSLLSKTDSKKLLKKDLHRRPQRFDSEQISPQHSSTQIVTHDPSLCTDWKKCIWRSRASSWVRRWLEPVAKKLQAAPRRVRYDRAHLIPEVFFVEMCAV